MAITTQKQYASSQEITTFTNAFMSKDTNPWAAMPVMLRWTGQTPRNCQEVAVFWKLWVFMHTASEKIPSAWHCPLSCFKMLLIKIKYYYALTKAEWYEQMLAKLSLHRSIGTIQVWSSSKIPSFPWADHLYDTDELSWRRKQNWKAHAHIGHNLHLNTRLQQLKICTTWLNVLDWPFQEKQEYDELN